MERVLHVEQPLGFLFGETMHGNTGPHRQHLSDLIFVDDRRVTLAGRCRLDLELGTIGDEDPLLVPQLGGPLELLGVNRLPLVRSELGDAVVDVADVRRQVDALEAHPAPRLIDQVDRLVREEPIRDVAVCQIRRIHQGLLGEVHLVVVLVGLTEPFENQNRVGHARLVDLDRLETALQRRVLLQVLAVLLERGGANRLQLAAGEHRFEDARRVDSALGRAGTDEGVDLVDEQDDVTSGADLLEDLLQAFLEVAPVSRPGDQGAEVEGVQVLVGEGFRHRPEHDLLGKSLNDGGLADTGLPDEHRVVLCATRQDLYDPLDLIASTDHRVELAIACQLSQVPAELVEHGGPAR